MIAIFGWLAFRPIPTTSDYETVAGKVASTTAVTDKGGNEFTLKLWVENQPVVAYELAAKLPGEVLGKFDIGPGSNVQMQALKAEIQKPSTGLFHNVPPTIEISSLRVDGKAVSTWDDYLKYRADQKKECIGLMVAVSILGGFLFFKAKRDQALAAR